MAEFTIPPMRHTCRPWNRCPGCSRDRMVEGAEAHAEGVATGAETLATARRVSSMYFLRTKTLAAVLLDARGLVRGVDPALDERIDAALVDAGFPTHRRTIRGDAMSDECEHPAWTEEGDGHGHNHWRCTDCGAIRWIAPWVTGEFR